MIAAFLELIQVRLLYSGKVKNNNDCQKQQ